MNRVETADVVLGTLIGLPTIGCLLHLWIRRGVRWWKRLAWSFVLLVPVIGPLFYGSLFRGLEPHGSGTRPSAGQGGIPYSRT